MSADRPNGPPILWPDLHPVAVDAWLMANLGPQYVDYLPETLWSEIRTLTGQQPPVATRNTIQALCLLRDPENDCVMADWDAFRLAVEALDGQIPNFIALEPPSVGTLLAGGDTIQYFRPGPFGDEVRRYCAGVARWHGLLVLPPPYEAANELLELEPRQQQMLLERASSSRKLSEDNPVDQQVARLREAFAYRDARRDQRRRHLEFVTQELQHAGRQ